ncbi:MAG TPA: hypothetical protein VMU16_03450 [Candidatus Binataceae bacterium]|nr:hypothetical protein [Candidatus Binataceae bacterium]
MAKFNPKKISGRWREGYALDLQTLSSTPIGYNEFGHMQFDNTRSEVGELLYRLKSKGDRTVVAEIAGAAEEFLNSWAPSVDIIVPVPASGSRPAQPVIILAKAISKRVGIPLAECVTLTRKTPQLKNVYDFAERLKLLKGLHKLDAAVTGGKQVLLFDDLYRSGATLNSITEALYSQGKAVKVFALTITKTRVHR